ncbi:MAG: hypothetical protein Q8O00_08820, partial [Holophaga sp.]|nr:hypothetical protein [Holophaga sp.]
MIEPLPIKTESPGTPVLPETAMRPVLTLAALLMALSGAASPGMAQDPPPQEGELAATVQLDKTGERVTLSFTNKSRRTLSLSVPQGMPLTKAPHASGQIFLTRPVDLKLAPGAARSLEVPVITVGDCPPGDYAPSSEGALAPDVMTVREFMKKADTGAMKYDPVSGRLALLVRRHGVDKGQQILASQVGALRAQQHRNVLSAAGLLAGGSQSNAALDPKLIFAVNNID